VAPFQAVVIETHRGRRLDGPRGACEHHGDGSARLAADGPRRRGGSPELRRVVQRTS
jgi:hypothetical protein